MITKIQVNTIDQSLLEKIETAHNNLKALKDEVKELLLNLDSASGDKETAIQIAEILHSDASIIPVTNASGNLDVAGTVLTATGYEGRRTADPKSTFIINDGEGYGKDSRPQDLEGIDYAIYDTMTTLTGKRDTIFKRLLEGGTFSAVVAKKSGIIDGITGFKSAFRPQKSLKGRGKKKATTPVAVVNPNTSDENSEAAAESKAPKTVIRTRKSQGQTETTDGIQRGRVRSNG